MKKMFVIGAYGCGNRGDDAILQSICHLFPDWEICSTNGTYENVESFLPVRIVPCRLNEGFSLSVLGSMIRDSFGLLREIAKADLLMFGGGSLIHDLTPYNLPFLFFWHAWAKVLRKKVCYFSMGVGPLKTSLGKKFARYFLRRADGLFVRDRRGYDLCQSLGLDNAVLTADAAFAVQGKNQCGGQMLPLLNISPGNYFCVTGSQWFQSSNFWRRDQMDFSNLTQGFARVVQMAAEQLGKPVIFVPTVMHDLALAAEIQRQLPNVDFRIVPPNWNCKQMAEIIENASFLLGVRMHSIIFAARQGVPFVALIYDEKVRQLLKYLGMAENGIPIEEMNEEKVKIQIADTMERQMQIEENLKQVVLEFNVKIDRSVQYICNLVKE